MSIACKLVSLVALALFVAAPLAGHAQTPAFDTSSVGTGQRFADGNDWKRASTDEKQACTHRGAAEDQSAYGLTCFPYAQGSQPLRRSGARSRRDGAAQCEVVGWRTAVALAYSRVSVSLAVDRSAPLPSGNAWPPSRSPRSTSA